MKNRNSILQKSIFILLVLIGSACSREDLNETKPNMVADISVNSTHGYLEFKDLIVFDKTKELLNTMDKEGMDDWENDLDGFISLRSIYETALMEEEKYFENLSKSSPNLELKPNSNMHSDFVKEHADILIINNGFIELNIPVIEQGIEALVNKNGFISIGGVIYKYSKDNVKIIRDGDTKNISLLSNIEESAPDKNILVHDFQTRELNLSGTDNAFSGDAGCTGYTGGGGQKVEGSAWSGVSIVVDIYGNYGYPGQLVYQGRVGVKAVNKKKNFGWSTKRTTQLKITGTINYNVIGTPLKTQHVNLDTGGKLLSSIGRTYYIHPWTPTVVSIGSFYGNLTFNGRHGTTCSI